MTTGNQAAGPFCRRLFLPESHIESVTRDMLASVGLLPEIPGPISIERFIYLAFGFEEEYDRLPKEIMGCAKFTREGLDRIVINRELAEQDDTGSRLRVRSTLAHEAGHGIFHSGIFKEKINRDATTHLLGHGDSIFRSVSNEGFMCRAEVGINEITRFEWWEHQANLAMSALLLPRHLITEAARQRLPAVLSGSGEFQTRITAAEREIAELFSVSRKMISIRLQNWWHNQATQPTLF